MCSSDLGGSKGGNPALTNHEKDNQKDTGKVGDKVNLPPNLQPTPSSSSSSSSAKEKISHTARETPFLTAGLSKAFLKFYETYPRPLKKRDAWDQWQITVVTLASERGQNDATVEQWLIDRAEAFGASPAGLSPPPGDQDFRPAPDAWLKAGRYDDPPSEWMRPNGKSKKQSGFDFSGIKKFLENGDDEG